MIILDYYHGMDMQAGHLIREMPISVYLASDGISNSGLSLIARSPAHYRYAPARETTRAQVIGSALHSCLLEPELFRSYYINSGTDDRRAAAYKQAVTQIGNGDRVLTSPEYDDIQAAVESVWSSNEMRRMIDGSVERELSVFTTDPITGVTVRIRPDIVRSDSLADLKKTMDARPAAFERSIINYRYHVQAALYLDAWEWATGERFHEFYLLAVESESPYASKVYRLDDTAISEGRKLYREALDLYARCLEYDEWPAYHNQEPELIGLPSWALAQIENELDDRGITTEEEP